MTEAVVVQREHFRAWLDAKASAPPSFRETHVSILGLTADRVWKLKKAVKLPFVDLSTRELRLANCEREVALNRRLAPDVYLGVVPLTDERGVVIDHLVEMRRLPDDRRLAALVSAGVDTGCVEQIADLLARFHATAPTGAEIDRSATAEALAELWSSSIAELDPFVGRLLDRAGYENVGADARRYLAGRAELFDQRIADGRIRDGHGDLLADDVFCLDDGPRLLDCLEFDDRLRFGDVLADAGFLAMDLERLRRPDLARRLLDHYRELTGDAWPASLEHFYVASRAVVRVKVACLRVAEVGAGAGSDAVELLALAERHLARGRVRLVLIGGSPATGKTTLSRELARVTGWRAVHSDEVRKQLAGLEPTTSAAAPVGRGLYADSWTALTYAELLDHARLRLARGESVILDASWSSDERRSQAAQVAGATASELVSLVCETPPNVADARAAARSRRGSDASDASAAMAAELRAGFAPWPEAVTLDTRSPAVEVAERVLAHLGLAG